jgi:peptide/nickel transport system substrate-binding protein
VRKPPILALALVLMTACVACGGSGGGAAAEQAAGDRIIWAKAAEADLLDPNLATSGASWELLDLVYEGLVGVDDELKVVPELAESWQQPSPTTYVFTLRKGVKFSNGRELTADDVVGSLKRLLDPKLGAFWTAQLAISSVTARGDQVVVTLSKPQTSFLAALAGSPAAVLPMRELADGSFDPQKDVLGTGPYKVVSHAQGATWMFARNQHYWRPGLPKVPELTVRIMPDDAARTAALRDGSADVATFDRPDSIRLLESQRDVKTVVQATTDYYVLMINSKTAGLRDDRLRQAIASAIDRQQISKVALAGQGKATAAAPIAFGGACDPARLPFAQPDLDRTRQLVSAAGATGRTVEITTATNAPMTAQIAQVPGQNLKQAGLELRNNAMEPGLASKRRNAGQFELYLSWFAGYADPGMVLSWWNPEVAGFNKAWANPDPRLNALISKSQVTPAGPARNAILQQTCERIAAQATMIPVVSKDAIVAYRTDRVEPRLQPVEGYAVPLRHLPEFGLK